MQVPVQVSFLGFDRSEAIETLVREKVDKLRQFCPDIVACRVAVSLVQKHQNQGNPYGVRVDLTIPGQELVSNREQHEDAYVAVRNAFADVRRMLESAVEKRRGDVKAH